MAIESGAVLKIRNDSGSSYVVEELGGYSLDPGAEVDLMDEAIPGHYDSWEAARALVHSTPTAKLFQDIQGGDITITSEQRPTPPALGGAGPMG